MATASEAALAPRNFEKYYSVDKTRAIKKIQKVFTLPAHTIALDSPAQFQAGELLFQYNMTVGVDFCLLQKFALNTTIGGVLTVKYRENDVVHRYALYGNQENLFLATDVLAFPLYNNQVIRSNCVFEFWATSVHPECVAYGLPADFEVVTSILVNPDYAEELEREITGPTLFEKDDIGVARPETLPYDQDNQVWLNNELDVNFVVDNGFDPILRSPYPPVNFQVVLTSNPITLTWNVPDLMISVVTISVLPEPYEYIFLTNYDSGLTTASQVDNIVTLASGGVRFVDTASDAGRKIKWSEFPGVGDEAVVVTVLSSTTAIVSDSKTVAAAKFVYLPPGIIFKLWVFNPNTAQYVEVADSGDLSDPPYIFTYQINEPVHIGPIVYAPNWMHTVAPGGGFLSTSAYITGEFNGFIITSQSFATTVPFGFFG